MLIETKGYNGELLYLAKGKILAMKPHKNDPNKTAVFMDDQDPDGRPWVISEPVAELRIKYDNAERPA